MAANTFVRRCYFYCRGIYFKKFEKPVIVLSGILLLQLSFEDAFIFSYAAYPLNVAETCLCCQETLTESTSKTLLFSPTLVIRDWSEYLFCSHPKKIYDVRSMFPSFSPTRFAFGFQFAKREGKAHASSRVAYEKVLFTSETKTFAALTSF